ncbi:MAG: nicotinate-nucleotide--dimethylbenzimidazole phosphoribosyltransferase, partial [Spirochaetes bacterium]|nr:nicotinate-nucleotide--dimethylbenzimidazole phosphoribosyltransferase [Spirochaetota bacterium]
QYDIDLKVVDAGVKGDLSGLETVLNRKVALGTANAAREPAMSESQLLQALRSGMEVFSELHQARPVDLLGLGEMGIGNTSAAALLIAARSAVAVADLTGRGTGLNDGQLSHKQEVLQRVFALHELDKQSAFEQLRRVGGFEIAQMAGAAIAAAAAGVPVVLDGVISTAAGLMADALLPGLRDSLIIAHRSVEHAQAAAARVLGLDPVVDLGLRLGEGSGAAITLNLVDTACRIFREMASFAEAGVSTGG